MVLDQIRLSAIVIRAPCSLDILELPWFFPVFDVVEQVDSFREKNEQNSSNFSSSSSTGRLTRVRLCLRHLAKIGAAAALAVGGDNRGESAKSCDDETIDIGFLSCSEWPDDFERDRDRLDANFRGRSRRPLRRLEWRFFSFFSVSSPLSSILSAMRDG